MWGWREEIGGQWWRRRDGRGGRGRCGEEGEERDVDVSSHVLVFLAT